MTPTRVVAPLLFAVGTAIAQPALDPAAHRIPQELTAPLPELLVSETSEPIATADRWSNGRRPELLELFRTHVYGRAPVGRPERLLFRTVETNPTAMDGDATLERIAITYGGPGGEGVLRLTLFTPNAAPKPRPGFLLICNRDEANIDPSRERKSPFWPAEAIVARGYFAAAFHYEDLDADDKDDRFADGVHAIYDPPRPVGVPRPADAWGALAAWAWGASRALDYLETNPRVDASRVAVVGHSRGGKAALWAGADDERFAMTVANNSGCGGAALARRDAGESIADILRFRNWFCRNYDRYADNGAKLPVDQHQLIALIAPRLAYVASASEDAWADPRGEFLACVHATPAYELFGLGGVGFDAAPAPGGSAHGGAIGYHLRSGGHNLTPEDWGRFMDFADRHGWRR